MVNLDEARKIVFEHIEKQEEPTRRELATAFVVLLTGEETRKNYESRSTKRDHYDPNSK